MVRLRKTCDYLQCCKILWEGPGQSSLTMNPRKAPWWAVLPSWKRLLRAEKIAQIYLQLSQKYNGLELPSYWLSRPLYFCQSCSGSIQTLKSDRAFDDSSGRRFSIGPVGPAKQKLYSIFRPWLIWIETNEMSCELTLILKDMQQAQKLRRHAFRANCKPFVHWQARTNLASP